MKPSPVVYPLSGLITITPAAPLPATTLPGETALCTVMVYCGVTERTVTSSGGEETVPEPSVPVMVTV